MKLLVQVTFEIEVEYEGKEGRQYFDIEENGCPGTGIIGAAIEKVMEECSDANICWGCRLNGKNEIIKIDGARIGP